MSPNSENNKRIAKNTFFLYIRMLFSMGVSIYTSRVVLATLGVTDYGIYNVVGGITAMFAFLNASMSGATSRFLIFELGQNNTERLQKTFSSALTVHLIIAGFIFVLGETAGLWYLENKLVIPVERMNAARYVYQLSILSSMLSIIQVPYNASIIAHERMDVYAYIEILNTSLKLGIVYLLVTSLFDKLILYAVLVLCVSFLIVMIYRIYCVRRFPECKYVFRWDKGIINPMLAFSGWDLYGNMSITVKTQGVNMLLNLFFGVAINAAYAISTQVGIAIGAFSNNFLTAVRPQIVKLYATEKIEEMQNLIFNASKFSFLLLFFIAFPFILENHFVLHLWLKEVPDYAVIFCQLVLTESLVYSIFAPVGFAIHATGKIKGLSIITGSIYIMVIPISYCLLKTGFPPVAAIVTNVVLTGVCCVVFLYLLRTNIRQFSIKNFFLKVLFTCLCIIVITIALPVYLHYSLSEGWMRFFIVGFSFVVFFLCFTYCFALDKNMRKRVWNIFPHIDK